MFFIKGRNKKVNHTCKNMGNRLMVERFMCVVAVIFVIAILPQFLIVPYRNYTLIFSRLDDESNMAAIYELQETPDSSSDEELQIPVDELTPRDSDSLQESVDTSIPLDGTVLKKSMKRSSPISYMNTLLLQKSPSANPTRQKSLSARDKELLHARIQIENAPIRRDVPEKYASLFRNYSTFIRSYELMERVLKVYIYKEGLKPIFHKPHLKGIYASEGWFMKQMLEDSHFVVRNSRKAHLFYFPFSSRRLSRANFPKHRDLTNHLESYVQLIAAKYSFWNRTKGADHFLVACHDWAPGFTNNSMRSCIRAICNSNIFKGFQMWKDVSLPVTNVPLSEIPVEDPGGFPASQRRVLAFFAGSMHGDLRPILINHWNDKVPDMKVFGQLGHDAYIEFMKSSKYCICAKGYEVHTPRVVESIYYDCVPVILSDDYVPPLFDVFEWESFSVFVLEEDVPNLREILLSIPEEKYMDMQNRVKMVKQHFLWHQIPVKYDLFHMVLHSIWYKRVFQVKSK